MIEIPLNELGFDPEFATLGCFIVFPDRSPIPRDVTVEWFAHPAARIIFSAIEDVAAMGVMPGPIPVRRRLESTGNWDRIGGEDFFAEVMQACTSPAQLPDLLKILEPAFATRKLREVTAWLDKSAGMEGLTSAEISNRLIEAASIAAGCVRPPVRAIGEVDHEGGDLGVTTGFASIDQFMSTGGYASGQTNIVSAYHKGGKTTFKLSSAVRQLQHGKRVLWATFADLGERQLKRRIMRNLCGWSKRPDRLDLLEAYDESLAWLNRAPLDVYDASILDHGYDVDTFAAWLRAEHGVRGYDCVFVDYAQKLRSTRRASNETAEATYCSDTMHRLAAKTGLPIVIGSQITKGNTRDGTETKTKGSRAWEEDAGMVIRLSVDGALVAVEIPYSRFGPPGDTTLCWDQERLRVVD